MGQILRVAVLLIGIWLVYRIVRDLLRRAQGTRSPGQASAPKKMIACEKCGTYVPRNEVIERNGKLYCSDKHAAKP